MTNHMTDSRETLNAMRTQMTVAHDHLASAYLLLTRPIDEATRTEALNAVNDSMSMLRNVGAYLDHLAIANRGIDEDLARVATLVREIRPSYVSVAARERNTEAAD